MKTVYSVDGYEYQLVETTPHGHIVRPVRLDGDGYEHVGQSMILDEVFNEAPTDKLHAKIAKEQEKLADIQTRVFAAKCELDDLKRNNEAILKKFRSSSPALQRIDDFIEDRITHFVVAGYGKVEVLTKAAILSQTDHRYDEAKMRMLCLFGRSKGDFVWKINTYSDGSSGSWTEVTPCRSHEEATEVAKKWLTNEVEEISRRGGYIQSWSLKLCELFGVSVPKELLERTNKMDMSSLVESEKKAIENLAAIQKSRAELERKIGGTNDSR